MIIDFNRTVAYICSGCGEITFGEFSLFELSGERGVSVKCSCGKSQLRIFPKSKTSYVFSLRCLMCDEEHEFEIPLIDLMRENIIEFSCPDILIGLVFVGKKDYVAKAVKENDTYISEVTEACGLGHTGKNGLTMLKALDKIQELSNNSCLTCQCGSNMIDVDVSENEIILVCCRCGASVAFTADEIRRENFSDISEIYIQKSDNTEKDKN